MSNVPVEKTVFNKDFNKVIDTNFKELGIQGSGLENETSIEDFFVLYESLFYNIPKEGNDNSHRFILNKTADYLGVSLGEEVDVQALLNEITTLRQELLDIKKLNETS